MKFRIHTCGMFIAIAASVLVSTLLAAGLARFLIERFSSAPLDRDAGGTMVVVGFFVVPAFFAAYFVAGRLYEKYIRVSCPNCGHKVQMNYRPGAPVSYECPHCDFSFETHITIGDGGGGWR